jgi:hypothetical protein
MKLGKSASVYDSRTLQFSRYLDINAMPACPDRCLYGKDIAPAGWGLMGNDKVNDCTCAAAAHLMMEWTWDNSAPFVPADSDIIAAYTAITGYNAVTGANNISVSALCVLNYWRKNGIARRKIQAFAAVDLKKTDHVKYSVFLFGGCFAGLSLPTSAQKQEVWSIISDSDAPDAVPGSWGGHAVAVIGYDSDGLTIVTWGAVKKMTWQFWNAYCDEAYAIISTDFFAPAGTSSGGFNIRALYNDLKYIAQ